MDKRIPAAGFVQIAKSQGAKTFLLNLEIPERACDFDVYLTGIATELVPQWISALTKGLS